MLSRKYFFRETSKYSAVCENMFLDIFSFLNLPLTEKQNIISFSYINFSGFVVSNNHGISTFAPETFLHRKSCWHIPTANCVVLPRPFQTILSATDYLISLTDINECDSSPCQNGATCNNNINSYSCTCAAGYSGINCETGKNTFWKN